MIVFVRNLLAIVSAAGTENAIAGDCVLHLKRRFWRFSTQIPTPGDSRQVTRRNDLCHLHDARAARPHRVGARRGRVRPVLWNLDTPRQRCLCNRQGVRNSSVRAGAQPFSLHKLTDQYREPTPST